MTQKDFNIVEIALHSEYEATGMYSKLTKGTTDKKLLKVLRHIKKEEIHHIKLLSAILEPFWWEQ